MRSRNSFRQRSVEMAAVSCGHRRRGRERGARWCKGSSSAVRGPPRWALSSRVARGRLASHGRHPPDQHQASSVRPQLTWASTWRMFHSICSTAARGRPDAACTSASGGSAGAVVGAWPSTCGAGWAGAERGQGWTSRQRAEPSSECAAALRCAVLPGPLTSLTGAHTHVHPDAHGCRPARRQNPPAGDQGLAGRGRERTCLAAMTTQPTASRSSRSGASCRLVDMTRSMSSTPSWPASSRTPSLGQDRGGGVGGDKCSARGCGDSAAPAPCCWGRQHTWTRAAAGVLRPSAPQAEAPGRGSGAGTHLAATSMHLPTSSERR